MIKTLDLELVMKKIQFNLMTITFQANPQDEWLQASHQKQISLNKNANLSKINNIKQLVWLHRILLYFQVLDQTISHLKMPYPWISKIHLWNKVDNLPPIIKIINSQIKICKRLVAKSLTNLWKEHRSWKMLLNLKNR